MFERLISCAFKATALVIFSLFSLTVSADSSYQFSLGAYGEDIDYEGSAEGEELGLYAAAYLEPIKLNDSMPYSLIPFYTRTSGLFLNSSKSRVTDLFAIRGGQILRKADAHHSSIGMRLANAELPVWTALEYTRIGSSHYDYADGTSSTVDRRYITSATVGWFINETLGVYGFYEDDNDVDSYGVGTHYLYALGDLGFVEVGLQYTKIDIEEIGLEVVNGTVRNANVSTRNESIRAVSLSYFPTVKAEIGLRYRKMDSDHGLYGYSVNANASYYILSNLQLGMSYVEVHHDEFLEYKLLSGSASFKF